MYFTFGHVSQTWKTKMYPHVTAEFSKPAIVTGSYMTILQNEKLKIMFFIMKTMTR